MARNPLRRLQRRTFGSGGVRTRVHVLTATGAVVQDGAPTYVLLHGLGVSSRYFVPLAEKLAAHGSVVIFDLPGFGGLPTPRRRLTLRQFARIVALVLGELHVRRPILIGHSFGAQIAIEILAAHPEVSDAALIIGPIVNADERELRRLAFRFAQSALHEKPRNAAVSLRAYLRSGLSWPNLLLPEMLGYPIEERIAEVSAALCLLTGEHDATCPEGWLRHLAEAAVRSPHTEVVVVPGAAHQMVIGHAAVVAERAIALAEHPAES